MKRNQIKELKMKPRDELVHLLGETHEALRKMQLELFAGKLKNVRALPEAKKKIARILTFLNSQ